MLRPLAARRVLGSLAVGEPAGGAASTLLDGLGSYWKMDEASGDRVDLVSGYNFTPNGSIASVAGKIGNAADINQSDAQWMAVNHTFVPAESGFTWAEWQYKAPAASAPILLCLSPVEKPASGSCLTTLIDNSSGGRFMHILWDSVSGTSIVYVTGIGLTDAWRLYVFGYDAAVKRAWGSVNGSAKTYAAAALAHGINLGGTWATLGYASGYKVSRHDEMGFWPSRVLTDAEIVELYNGGAGKTHPFT